MGTALELRCCKVAQPRLIFSSSSSFFPSPPPSPYFYQICFLLNQQRAHPPSLLLNPPSFLFRHCHRRLAEQQGSVSGRAVLPPWPPDGGAGEGAGGEAEGAGGAVGGEGEGGGGAEREAARLKK